jgi:hypothetical protein
MVDNSLTVELGEGRFNEPKLYFLSLRLDGGAGSEVVQERTEVAKPASTSPAFKKDSFTFKVPPDAKPEAWSMHLSAMSVATDDEIEPAGGQVSVVGVASLAIGTAHRHRRIASSRRTLRPRDRRLFLLEFRRVIAVQCVESALANACGAGGWHQRR